MQVTETLSQGLKREFKVVLPAADLATRLEGQLTEMQAKARINGFRPGKVPVAHLKRLYGRAIMAEVVQEAVNDANRKIVEENDLRLASDPKIDFVEDKDEIEKALEAKADFAFTVALEVLPKIEVGDFGDIEIERLTADVTESEIDEVLNGLAEQNRAYTPKEGDSVIAEKGDKATLDFLGKIDGEAFEGGAGQGVDVVLGSESYIPGFEAGVEGMKVGESQTISLTFPQDYSAAELAGKDATFDITLKGAAAPSELKIDDSLAQAFGIEDLGKMRDSIRVTIERDYAAASRRKWKRSLLDALDKKYSFDLPQGLVAQEFDSVWRKLLADQNRSGQSFESEGTTEEAAREDYRKIAERRVRLGLLLADIGEKAGVKVTEDEVRQALVERARSFPGQEKMIWDFYHKNPQAIAEIRAPLFEEKVVDHIVENVKVLDRKVSKQDLLKLDDEEDSAAEDLPAQA